MFTENVCEVIMKAYKYFKFTAPFFTTFCEYTAIWTVVETLILQVFGMNYFYEVPQDRLRIHYIMKDLNNLMADGHLSLVDNLQFGTFLLYFALTDCSSSKLWVNMNNFRTLLIENTLYPFKSIILSVEYWKGLRILHFLKLTWHTLFQYHSNLTNLTHLTTH
jgi:hypothetical protein